MRESADRKRIVYDSSEREFTLLEKKLKRSATTPITRKAELSGLPKSLAILSMNGEPRSNLCGMQQQELCLKEKRHHPDLNGETLAGTGYLEGLAPGKA